MTIETRRLTPIPPSAWKLVREFIPTFYRNRDLIWNMAVFDLHGQTKGSLLGLIWIALVPLIQTLVYVVFISFIFKVRGATGGGAFDYAIYVMTGQMTWVFMTRSIMDAPMVLRKQIALIKQVVYPVETLPLTSLLIAGVGSVFTFIVALVLGAVEGLVSWTILLFPLALVLMLLFLLGSTWILMLAGVILKDLREIISVVFSMMFFLSPVILTEKIVGPTIWTFILLNPFAHVVIAFRDLFYGTFHPMSWIIFLALTIATLVVGALLVARTQLMINEYV